MKTNKTYLLLAIIAGYIMSFGITHADDHGHEHDHDHKGHEHDHDQGHDDHDELEAPNGGRIIESIDSHLEFFVTSDRKVQITFLDDHGHVVAPSSQKITLIGGDRSSPTRLSFSKQGNVLVSSGSLPSGNNLPIVLQIKATPNSKTVIERFMLNMSDCPTCEYKEYACVCEHDGHDHDDHSGHKH